MSNGDGGEVRTASLLQRGARAVHRLALEASSAFTVSLTRLRGIRIGAGTVIAPGGQFTLGFHDGRPGRIDIGAKAEIERGVVLNAFGGSISVGERVVLGPYVAVYGHGGVTIGDHCLISMHSQILSSNHAVPPFGTLVRSQADVRKPTAIGRDVWLGSGCSVLAGVSIGDGCIVGAGAVVARDLPPGAIALGVPARVVKYRRGAGP